MSRRTPEIHQRITLEITDGLRRAIYDSYVVDVDEAHMVAGLPTVGAQWVTLEPGLELMVGYTNPDGVYVVPARIVSRSNGPPATLTLAITGAVQRRQRREYVRLDVVIPVKYRQQSAAKGGELRVMPTFQVAKTRDLSAGGALLATPQPLRVGDILELEFMLDAQRFTPLSRVLRVQTVDLDGVREHRAGVEFLELPDSARDRIVRFLFQEQIRRRKQERE